MPLRLGINETTSLSVLLVEFGGKGEEMSTAIFCERQMWGIAVCGLANAVLALSLSIAAAAEIKPSNLKDDTVEISISGNIAPGDADLLQARVKEAADAGKRVTSVRLNSEGGNLLEGARLAEVVRSAKVSTNVGQNATCASACFLIFAAGETKYAYVRARIGVHGASENGTESRKGTKAMARIAEELDVPESIIRRMINTPPNDVTWLSLNDLRLMGADINHYKDGR
jgi:hypothetical protein